MHDVSLLYLLKLSFANVTELNSLVTLYRWNMGAEVLLSTLL